eukprot:scaffold1761_cov78-Skeletonema_dohrnii-CCMP3373.AAC.2
MTYVHRIDTNLTTLDVGRPSSSAGEEWQSFKILFHGFADLPSAVGQCTRSPEFTCNGHRWCIDLFPGGDNQASMEHLSLFLRHCSGGCATATGEVGILPHSVQKMTAASFDSDNTSLGWVFCARSVILKKSMNILDEMGPWLFLSP